MFELVMFERNSQGLTTSNKKSFSSEKAYDLWQFYVRNCPPPKRKKGYIPNAKEAAEIVASLDLGDEVSKDTVNEVMAVAIEK